MTWYAWPEHWLPRDFSMRILPNIRDFEGAYTPSVDVVDLLGERWMVSMSLPPEEDPIEVAAREAFFDRLKGRAHGITLSHLRLPVPQGTLRGAPTLSASAAQLANTISITNARSGDNLIRYSGLELDVNADGLADGWGSFTLGTTGTVTMVGRGGVNSARAQQINAAGLGTSLSDRAGIFSLEQAAVSEGLQYSLSADFIGYATTTAALAVNWYTAGDVFITQSLATWPMSVLWTRREATFTAPATAAKAQILAFMAARTTVGYDDFGVDNIQFQQGVPTAYAGPATARAGDMIGVQGQLVRVMANATLDDAGAGTVEFQPRVRAAAGWNSGSALTLTRPTANFILRNRDGVPNMWMPGYAEGPQFDLIEAW